MVFAMITSWKRRVLLELRQPGETYSLAKGRANAGGATDKGF